MPERVGFKAMKDGSAEDFRLISENDLLTAKELPERIIAHLRLLADDDGAYQISRLDHILQTATRCEQSGADDDWIAAALIHDLGDILAPFSHAELASEIIRPFVREEVAWAVKHHGVFQMHYNKSLSPEKRALREQFKDSPHYQSTIHFCEAWDQCSFDPDFKHYPLDHFKPLIHRVFTRSPFQAYDQ